MANRRAANSKNTQRLIIATLVVVGLGSITYGILSFGGFFSTPEAKKTAQQKSREGKVPVLRSLKNLEAFETVKREDVYDLKRGNDSYFWLPKEQVDAHPEWVTKIDDVVGRVMARDKQSDFVFKKSDFLPEGSRSGLMGGVPVGKQGFFLDVDKIPGLRFLKKGDRFDLLVNLPEDAKESAAEYGLVMGGIKVQGGVPVPLNGIRILARGAELVALTTNRTMTTQGGLNLSTTDKNGKEIRNAKDERVLIAIAPQESVPLTDALGNDLQIHLVVHSGQNANEADPQKVLEGMIAFPASAKKIGAFSKITANDLADPVSGELRRYFFRPDAIKDSWLPKPEDLIGKVVSREIEPGYIFSKDDFLAGSHLLKDVDAYAVLVAADLVDGEESKWLGKVVGQPLQAGSKLDDSNVLLPGSLVKEVAAMTPLLPADLVEGNRSMWLGKVVSRDLPAGHRLSDGDILPDNGLLSNVKAFQSLKASDLVGGNNSVWLGRVTAVQLNAGQIVDASVLLSPGARPGLSGAIPPKHLAVSIPRDAARGLDRLTNGDRIDLVESTDFNLAKQLEGVRVSNRVLNSVNKSVNKVVASNVLVIDRSDDQVVMAVKVSEVSAVTRALAKTGKVLSAMTRPDPPTQKQVDHSKSDPKLDPDEAPQLESDPDPLESIIVTKLIIDGERTEMAFRRSSDE